MKKEKFLIRDKLTKDQILTIPNLLSFIRILLIPLIVWLYCVADRPGWTLVVITISGLTDVVDGFIARRFNMMSDFGKAIDPIADKLTQMAVLVSLVFKYKLMLLLIIYMVIKELVSFILRLIVYRRTKIVDGAKWHGKLNTVVLYLIMTVHILWYEITKVWSTILILISFSIMVMSSVLYTISSAFCLIRGNGENKNEKVLDK